MRHFSVILCTYNRRSLVLSALASLRRQTLPYDQFEVLVVDNGSSDGTRQTIYRYINARANQRRLPADTWRVRYILEPRNGLAHARNRALQAASGEIAVFLDDDALADPHLLEHLLVAYQETAADAIGGRVDLRWEAPRPYWLTDDLLPLLGYFVPSNTNMLLPDSLSLSNCNFSAKISALRSIGLFSPFISKRLHAPVSMESEDFCRCLRSAGYKLWYTPTAIVTHRISAPRLQRAFFTGRAYWQGRAEVMNRYTDSSSNKAPTSSHILRVLYHELHELIHLALLHRPLLALARASSNEQLRASMDQARLWGHVHQLVQYLEHAPITTITPSILLVCPSQRDILLLRPALSAQKMRVTSSIADIPPGWLWRHRAHSGQSIGIVHVYQPGAFQLNQWQQQRFYVMLWLAQLLGIRIVTTDAGGWWQNVRPVTALQDRFLLRRLFERRLLACSNLVLTYMRHPEEVYADKKLQARLRSLRHPGFRGYYPPPVPGAQARSQLGLPQNACFVYLCLTHMHSEHEIKYLIDAFDEAQGHWLNCSQNCNQDCSQRSHSRHPSVLHAPQLLLVGEPRTQKYSFSLLKQIAMNSSIHLFMQAAEEQIPLYIGASDALVLPHFALPAAGVLATAVLALSYERVAVVPDLPRFRGLLPPYASVFYDPAHRSSLTQALHAAQKCKYVLTPKGLATLDAERSWLRYAQQLVEIYKQLLFC
jgi:glycosyltransferase involved in cell wall biosynthesis